MTERMKEDMARTAIATILFTAILFIAANCKVIDVDMGWWAVAIAFIQAIGLVVGLFLLAVYVNMGHDEIDHDDNEGT